MAKKVKRQKTLYSIFGRIVDVIIYPVLVLSFLSSFFMLIAKTDKYVPPIFGYSFVRVLSGSMRNSGFKLGDVVFVKQTPTAEIRVGDIIAFHNYSDPTITQLTSLYNGTTYQDVIKNISGLEKDGDNNFIFFENRRQDIKNLEIGQSYIRESDNRPLAKIEIPSGRLSTQQAIEKSGKVNFHMVVNIYVDQTGTTYYETRGTSNGSSDSAKVREDLVMGRYSDTARWLRDIIKFCSTTAGMLIIVVIPLSIVVLLEMLSVLEQINNILIERKVLNRAIKFDDKDVDKANVGIEMREFDKAYLYDIMPPEQKQKVFHFLWGYMQEVDNKKIKQTYQAALNAVAVYDFENPQAFWEKMMEQEKSESKRKKYQKARQQAEKEKFAEVEIKEYQNTLQKVEEGKLVPKEKNSKNKKTIHDIDEVIKSLNDKKEN